MKLKNCSYFAGSLLLACALLMSGGCGYKNNPVPPQTVVPKAIDDLRYNLNDKSVKLTWSYPLETVSGRDIEENISFELFRAEIPVTEFCSSCPIPFGEAQEVQGGMNTQETRRVAEYDSGMLRSGHKYFFKVRSRLSWWASSNDSNIISFVYLTPAAAPAGLKAVYAKDGVVVSWNPVTTLTDGSPAELPLSYQVMKSSNGKDFVNLGDPLTTTRITDREVATGNTYYYKVKSSLLFEGEVAEGSLSDSVKAAVRDTMPPAMVSGVTVVASTTNIRIFWDTVADKDLAGYRIYRRVEGEKAKVVGEVGATQTIFVDNTPVENARVYYSVTAFDTQKPANESKSSKEATTRY